MKIQQFSYSKIYDEIAICKVVAILYQLTCVDIYCQTFNIRCTLVGNKIVDHSDAVEASPIGAAPTTSAFST